MAKLDRLGCISKQKATQMFQKRRQKFHRREKSMIIIWSLLENSTEKLSSPYRSERMQAELNLQKIIATSDLSLLEKAKLRNRLAYGTYAGFQDLAAQYLAKYSKY